MGHYCAELKYSVQTETPVDISRKMAGSTKCQLQTKEMLLVHDAPRAIRSLKDGFGFGFLCFSGWEKHRTNVARYLSLSSESPVSALSFSFDVSYRLMLGTFVGWR